MDNNQNLRGLEWLIDEVEASLTQAYDALETYLNDPTDLPQLRFCLGHIHQVYGSLKIAECHGGVLLVEEMEGLVDALMKGSVSNVAEACEVLVQAILKVPAYLNNIIARRHDEPATLLTLLNDLRAVRAEPLVTETSLFAPDMSILADKPNRARVNIANHQALLDLAKKLRQMFQYALLGILKGIDVEKNVVNLDKVFARMKELCRGSRREKLWQVSGAVTEGIASNTIEVGIAVRLLLRDLDKELRGLAQSGLVALEAPFPERLLKNLLYYACVATAETPRIKIVRDEFKLHLALPEGALEYTKGGLMPSYDRGVVEAISGALSEEIGAAKDLIDRYIAEGDGAVDILQQVQPILKRIADTLAMVGQSKLRQGIIETQEKLKKFCAAPDQADDEALMPVASRLVDLEASLLAWARDYRRGDSSSELAADVAQALDGAQHSLLREVRNSLEKVKEAIVGYISSQWDKSFLQDAPDTMGEIYGALSVVGLDRPARVVKGCGDFVRLVLLPEEKAPEWSRLDALADAITSIEFYLESLEAGDTEKEPAILTVAEKALAELGDFQKHSPVLELELVAGRDLAPTSVGASQDVAAPELLSESVEMAAGYSGEEISQTPEIAAAVEEGASETVAPVTAQEQQAQSGKQLDDQESGGQEKSQDEDEVDPEIREIFIEEAREVLATIGDRYPQWAEGNAKAALVEIRRGFHTLKGSGRMVKAADIGNLAWSIENMLNRVLDERLEVTTEVLQVVDRTLQILPAMVDNYENNSASGDPDTLAELIGTADTLIAGRGEESDIEPHATSSLASPAEPGLTAEVAPAPGDVVPEEKLVAAQPSVNTSPVGELPSATALTDALATSAPELSAPPSSTAPAEEVSAESTHDRVDAVAPLPGGDDTGPAEDTSPIDSAVDPAARTDGDFASVTEETDVHSLPEVADASAEVETSMSPSEDMADALKAEASISIEAESIEVEPEKTAAETAPDSAADSPLDFGIYADSVEHTASSAALLAAGITEHDEAGIDVGGDALTEELASTVTDRSNGDGPDVQGATGYTAGSGDQEAPPSQLDDEFELANYAGAVTDAETEYSNQIAQPVQTNADSVELNEEVPAPGEPPVAETEIPEDSLHQIFANEAEGYLQAVANYLLSARDAAPIYSPPAAVLQQALHTLKGSASMAEMIHIGELVTPLERLTRDLFNFKKPVDNEVLQLLEDMERALRLAVENLRAGGGGEIIAVGRLVARVELQRERLFGGQHASDSGKPRVDPGRLNALMIDGLEKVIDADVALSQWQESPSRRDELLTDMAEELVELAAAAERAGITALDRVGGNLAAAYGNIVARELDPDSEILNALRQGHDILMGIMDRVAADQDVFDASEMLHSRLQAIANIVPARAVEQVIDTPPESETQAAPLAAADVAPQASDEPVSAASLLMAEFAEREAAREALNQRVSDSRETVETEETAAVQPEPPELAGGHDREITQFEANPEAETREPEPPIDVTEVSTGEAVPSTPVSATPHKPDVEVEADLDKEIIDIFLEEADELLEEIDQAIHIWQDNTGDRAQVDTLKRALHTFKGGARVAGLAGVGDISHDFETRIIEAESKREEKNPAFFHDLFARHDRLLLAMDRVRALYGDDAIAANAVAVPPPQEPMPGLKAPPETPIQDEQDALPQARQPALPPGWPTADVLPFTGGVVPEQDAPAKLSPAAVRGNKPQRPEPQEMIKIAAPVLDELVNLAGETSIARGRVEQQVSEFGFSLDEMEGTIQRLQDQVRRLGIETEAQVVFRRDQIEASAHIADFDPLEMDRYSQLQQLSRALQESASDLQDLKGTLLDKSRDAEALLLQQSRINTDLQESLMRTRMVPFSRLVPRLRRIVRQVGNELDKPVQLQLDNVEGEMDRTVLEKIIAPLEHMIRNAIDHGIEAADDREKKGKSRDGTIELTFGREGGDIVLRLADDGRGLDIKAIREQALARQLLLPEAQISDQEVMQFIFQPGFSTSRKVTQVSGRGVGMDVVSSQVRQLGGTISINSQADIGTEFVIRLPFTVSVNRALMIRNSDDLYALPLNTINGVVKMDVQELAHYYQDPNARFKYARTEYKVCYLGTLLNSRVKPPLDTISESVPLVLVHSDKQHYAVHVGSLEGSQEIVVKSLGIQFGDVMGLSGVTVLGDGRVVVILDLLTLLRAQDSVPVLTQRYGAEELAPPADEGPSRLPDNAPVATPTTRSDSTSAAPPAAAAGADDRIKTVMVVDDSVTVRKVTGRFLEREGFHVVTAKDGVDAMRLLQDTVPDLMLLDIEMPRMDGFEVARLVRSSSRLKQLPIIMITSRTGEKHRERALATGVNKYLGKPYQEEVLLKEVNELLRAQQVVG